MRREARRHEAPADPHGVSPRERDARAIQHVRVGVEVKMEHADLRRRRQYAHAVHGCERRCERDRTLAPLRHSCKRRVELHGGRCHVRVEMHERAAHALAPSARLIDETGRARERGAGDGADALVERDVDGVEQRTHVGVRARRVRLARLP
jgi:hypothetical protein